MSWLAQIHANRHQGAHSSKPPDTLMSADAVARSMSERRFKSPQGWEWIDVCGNPDYRSTQYVQYLQSLGEQYRIHPATIKDCLMPFHLPKVEVIHDLTVLIVRYASANPPREADTMQQMTHKLVVLWTPHILLTIHRLPIDTLASEFAGTAEIVRNWSQQNVTRDHIVNTLLDDVFGTFRGPLSFHNGEVDMIEQELAESATDLATQLYLIRRQVAVLRRVLYMTREVVQRYVKMSVPVSYTPRGDPSRGPSSTLIGGGFGGGHRGSFYAQTPTQHRGSMAGLSGLAGMGPGTGQPVDEDVMSQGGNEGCTSPLTLAVTSDPAEQAAIASGDAPHLTAPEIGHPHMSTTPPIARQGLYTQVDPFRQDVKDHLDSLLYEFDALHENTTDLLNLHLALAGNRTNRYVYVLAIFSAFFIPVTFLAGVWGMNFEFMPELHWKYGYVFAAATMLLSCFSTFGLLKCVGMFGTNARKPVRGDESNQDFI